MAVALFVTACQAFQNEDVPATLQAQNSTLSAEGIGIQATSAFEQTQVLQTAFAAETQVAQMDSINEQLLATVRVVNPATPPVIAGAQTIPLAGTPLAVGGMQFTDTVVTGQKQNSDGCAVGIQTEFTPASPEIYVITRVANLAAGTNMSADWLYEGQVVRQDSWTSTSDEASICVWFFITPADIQFTPGRWSVRVLANGTAVGNAVNFNIVEQMPAGQ